MTILKKRTQSKSVTEEFERFHSVIEDFCLSAFIGCPTKFWCSPNEFSRSTELHRWYYLYILSGFNPHYIHFCKVSLNLIPNIKM